MMLFIRCLVSSSSSSSLSWEDSTINTCLAYLIVDVLLVWLVIVAFLLIRPIIWPRIISYPWQLPTIQRQQRRDQTRTVILAGSYNPPHNGHLAMLQYLATRYGHVICVIGMNPKKKYLVSPQERADLLKRMIQATISQDNVRVEVVVGYIWRFAKKHGATIFFRGIRSWSRDGAEERFLQILNTWGPLLYGPLFWPIPTIYLQGKPEYNDISSTLIRDLCRQQQQQQQQQRQGNNTSSANNSNTKDGTLLARLEDLVPTGVVEEVANLYSRTDTTTM